MSAQTDTKASPHPLAPLLIEFLEKGEPPTGLFSDDVFCDFTLPHWRLQAQGIDEVVALRRQGHPDEGTVPRTRVDAFPGGFVIEFEERWHHGGQHWYSREMARADVENGVITQLSVYCTGDWDEARQHSHLETVPLIRP